MQACTKSETSEEFSKLRTIFRQIVDWLEEEGSCYLPHDEVERQLQDRGRELLRQLFQDHLDLRREREPRLKLVEASDGSSRTAAEQSNRELCTVFGEVTVPRLAFRKKGHSNLHPSDCVLNLPKNRYSHELRACLISTDRVFRSATVQDARSRDEGLAALFRGASDAADWAVPPERREEVLTKHALSRLSAIEVARGSFDDAVASIQRSTGVLVGKRQMEQMARDAAQDFDLFYQQKAALTCSSDVLVLSCDGKGIVMLNEYLRGPMRKKAQSSQHRLKTRLSKGEKRNRKRMATVGAVYDSAPVRRTVEDIVSEPQEGENRKLKRRPKTRNKWLIASVEKDTERVVSKICDEAERRDPLHRRKWVMLVDGACHQLDCIKAEASRRGISLFMLVDLVHVFEYLWKAAWCFFEPGELDAERWVYRHAVSILQGKSSVVTGAIRRKATRLCLRTTERKRADDCANYLVNKSPYLDYGLALRKGWPISTGVIEGACRHLVKDRMDITGARWSLAGAEAVLRLRAIIANDDFHNYWRLKDCLDL